METIKRGEAAVGTLERCPRIRTVDPRSVPWAIEAEPDVVAVDTTWGRLQPMEAAPGVRTVGELELVALAGQGARLVDSRVPGSFGGRTIPGAVTSLMTRCSTAAAS